MIKVLALVVILLLLSPPTMAGAFMAMAQCAIGDSSAANETVDGDVTLTTSGFRTLGVTIWTGNGNCPTTGGLPADRQCDASQTASDSKHRIRNGNAAQSEHRWLLCDDGGDGGETCASPVELATDSGAVRLGGAGSGRCTFSVGSNVTSTDTVDSGERMMDFIDPGGCGNCEFVPALRRFSAGAVARPSTNVKNHRTSEAQVCLDFSNADADTQYTFMYEQKVRDRNGSTNNETHQYALTACQITTAGAITARRIISIQ